MHHHYSKTAHLSGRGYAFTRFVLFLSLHTFFDMLLHHCRPYLTHALRRATYGTLRRANSTLVEFKNANIYRFGTKEPVLKDLSIDLKRDQRLVIVGPVSAGKSTLAEVCKKGIIDDHRMLRQAAI